MKHLLLAVLLTLSACTPQEQETRKIGGFKPVPATEYVAPDTEDSLPLRQWVPKRKPKAVILAIHGFNDYSYGFDIPGEYFKKKGIAVYAYDQRGFGQSARRGIWGGNENLASDVVQAAEYVKAKHPKTPFYVLGESMGGAIATTAVVRPGFPKIDGLILSAPAFWSSDSMPFYYRGVLWSMAHTFPEMKFTGKQLHILASSNIPLLRQMGKDPLFIKATRVDAIYGLTSKMDEAYESIPLAKSRTLLLYGAQDQVIPAKALNKAVPRFTVPLDIGYYPEGYHMLMRDLKRDIVLADIESWIKKPHTSLPSGFGRTHQPGDPAPKMTSPER